MFCRVTINTPNNILVLSFESVTYDYTLEDDKMPPMVQYSKYSDAPVRHQPYAYIRAQRMKRAGATNTKIINHGQREETLVDFMDGEESVKSQRTLVQKPEQTLHSAKSLSRKSMAEAYRIQSAGIRSEKARSNLTRKGEEVVSKAAASHTEAQTAKSHGDSNSVSRTMTAKSTSGKSVSYSASRPPPSRGGSKSRVATSFKTGTPSVVSVGGFQIGGGRADTDSEVSDEDMGSRQRRVSWAFENPLLEAKAKELTLPETKALLRSQIRAQGEVVPPDFIYLAVNAIQANMKPDAASKNLEVNRREEELQMPKKFGRPSSSPSRIDPRTRVPVEDLGLDHIRIEHGVAPDLRSEAGSRMSGRTSFSAKSRQTGAGTIPEAQTTSAYVTDFEVRPVSSKTHRSLHPRRVPSSIPRGRVLRPHTATAPRKANTIKEALDAENRPQSAGEVLQRPGTAFTMATGMTTAFGSTREKKHHGYSTSATPPSQVPMLMYSHDMMERLQKLRERRKERTMHYEHATTDPTNGRVSEFNDPMRSHVDFKLKTHEQVEQEMIDIAKSYADRKRREEIQQDRKQRQAWLEKVRSLSSHTNVGSMQHESRPKSAAISVMTT